MSVLVIGSVAFDTIETPFDKAERCLGGSASYISLASSYFTGAVRLVGVVGGDFPKKAITMFNDHNIDIEGLEIVKSGKTFHWHGKYHFDMNMRDTLSTELNVFADFNPRIPQSYKACKYVCLGNMDPDLQRGVLSQVEKPRLIVCDTMNFWIESKYDELMQTLKLVDVIIINDAEARELTKEHSLIKAGKKILTLGPKFVIVKKGEHGALLFTKDSLFSAPAYPLEDVFDPTGAGDTFAGGFIGWLAKTDDFSTENMRRAVIYGSVMASYTVEKFGLERLKDLSWIEINDRFREFKRLASFEEI
ncbi:MAG TPA: PfkB family carbohydrate kinase [Candidatus Kapabacteria bacterium]|nr:PfkB family carbohydrate kinase [Candidatus Kapabacteria bacterium]